MDKLDEVYSQINDLKSASTQLVEGAKTLQDGTEEYVSKSTEFADGLEAFNQGINTATNSYNKIDEGIDSVNSNISTLKSGANKLNRGASDLSDGLNSLQTGVSAGMVYSDNSSIPKTMHSGKRFLIYLFNAITGSGSVVSCAGYSRISNTISLHSTAFPSRM